MFMAWTSYKMVCSIVHTIDNCSCYGQFSTVWTIFHSMDNYPLHGKAIKCPLTVCAFVVLLVSDQNCPQDLDLSTGLQEDSYKSFTLSQTLLKNQKA